MAIDYERVMWDTTKYVNPQNMNQMDEGIKAACDAVDNMSFDETMTYAEYQALTPEQKADGTTRYIPDYNIGQSVIDNDSTSGTRTWGADKLSSNFSAINSTLGNLLDKRAVVVVTKNITTDNSGNAFFTDIDGTRSIVSVKVKGVISIPFFSSLNYWGVHIVDSNLNVRANTNFDDVVIVAIRREYLG